MQKGWVVGIFIYLINGILSGPGGGACPAAAAGPPTVDYLLQFGREGQGEGEFGGPHGIHASQEGLLYVADDLNHVIAVFGKDGDFVKNIGGFGREPGRLAYVDSVIQGEGKKLYVADTGNDRVQILDRNGQALDTIARRGLLGR